MDSYSQSGTAAAGGTGGDDLMRLKDNALPLYLCWMRFQSRTSPSAAKTDRNYFIDEALAE